MSKRRTSLPKPATKPLERGKQYIALARVSSAAQEAEGYSLDAQEAALQAWAIAQGGTILRMWKLAETASKAQQRTNFQELLAYAKQHAASLDGLLVYKVDRAARNMTDYGKLLDLELTYQIPLVAISQLTPDTPAGRMARNMMATMAAFFTDQLSIDVKSGLANRVKDGWFPTVAPYGYSSQRVDGRSIVVVEPREADQVKRIFDLYAYHHCTVDMVLARLHAEGRSYTANQPKWVRSKVHRVLRDRSYIGDISWHDGWVPGKHPPLVDRTTFDRVQTLLGDKIYKAHELLYGGELITCGHCGRPVTGEIVEKKQSGKVYIYYRCSRYTAADHPRVRLREEQIDMQIMDLFRSIQQPAAVADWFRETLISSTGHQQKLAQVRAADLQGQLGDVRRQQERLLNLHLAGSIDGIAFSQKNTELRDRLAILTAELEANDRGSQEKADLAMKVFELSQSLPQKWFKANSAEKRRILNMVCLNITLEGVSLSVTTRKPFNALVKGLQVTESGEGEIRTRQYPLWRYQKRGF